MSDEDDKAYFYSRAEAELEQAQRSDCPPAVKAHYEMAERYLDLCADDEPLATG